MSLGSPTYPLKSPLPDIGVSSPVIACLQDDPNLVDDRNFLGLHPALQRLAIEDCKVSTRTAAWMGGTQAVILCPRFFSRKLAPPKPGCLRVNRVTNKFAGLGNSIADTQTYVLLHELVHVYLGGVTDQHIIKREALAIQECFEIKARSSRFNPANYVFYTNSKYRMNLGNGPIALYSTTVFD